MYLTTCFPFVFPVPQVIDMPLLFETRSDRFMQISVCVHCSEHTQVRYLLISSSGCAKICQLEIDLIDF